MDAIECILSRRSIRKFKAEPVPKAVLMEVLETAMRAPSYRNGQPWGVTVVSGAKKEELSKILVNLIEKDVPIKPDIPEPVSWPAEIDARMKHSLLRRAAALGMDLKAPDLRKRSSISNSRFYGAPHGVFFHQDASLGLWSVLDMGMLAQTVMLAANANGLGTVAQGYLCNYSADVKAFLGIPPENRLMLGMSIGYPDLSDPAATFRTDRQTASELVKWVE